MDNLKLYGFTHVDQTADPNYFIHFLDDVNAEESVQAYKRLTYSLLELQPGQRVLDIACGTGEDVRAMAQRVVPGGQVVGTDSSQTMIDEARRRSADSGLPVTFQDGDAQQLDFPADSFDAVRCDRSFMHLETPRQALAEMVRVTRSGGRVLVYEVDFETVVIDAPDRTLCRKVINAWCDGFRDGWLGRRIPAWFPEVRLRDVEVVPATLRLNPTLANHLAGADTAARATAAGRLSQAEAEAWLQWLGQVCAAGRLFATLTGFIVVGRKTT